jgi:hypothetical protein
MGARSDVQPDSTLLTARWITGRFLQLDGSRAREGRGKNQTKIKKEMSDVSGTH